MIVPFDGKGVSEAVEKIMADLIESGVDVRVDDSDKRPGEKFFYWEMKGVPFRIDLGEKELEKDEVSVFIRDSRNKVSVKIDKLVDEIKKLGVEYDARLLKKADEFFGDKVVSCEDKDEIKKALDSGKIARFNFCSSELDGEDCAEFVEKELQARVMGTRADLDEKASGKCPVCGKVSKVVVYAGKSY